MQKRQSNRQQYFDEQSYTTKKYVIPYIQEVMPVTAGTKVAEIGCGEGGNLAPFLDMGCKVVGIDLSSSRIELAKKFFEDHPNKANLTLMDQDIYAVKDDPNLMFDLIIMRDTLEHIPDQARFLEHLKHFLKPGGKTFIGFPPWRMPFGGHQQLCRNKWLSVMPYFHILPDFLYYGILKVFGESDATLNVLREIKETRLSIQRYNRILADKGFHSDHKTYFMINPNYEVKFKLKSRKLPSVLSIPYLRDFYTTALYDVISVKK